MRWILVLAACSAPRAIPAHRECSIYEVHWPGAEDDYDRAATIDALTALEGVIRDAAAVGPDEVARRLDVLFRKPPPSAFVSKWSVEAATRLRQLACAQQIGNATREAVDERYVQLISDLEDERAVIIDEMRRKPVR